LIFPTKQVRWRFSLNCHFLVLGPLSNGLGTNLKLSTNKIAWLHWSLNLGPSSKGSLSPWFGIAKEERWTWQKPSEGQCYHMLGSATFDLLPFKKFIIMQITNWWQHDSFSNF
jgi:hypothetical protein